MNKEIKKYCWLLCFTGSPSITNKKAMRIPMDVDVYGMGRTRQNVIHEEVKAIHAGLSVVTKKINNTKERSLTCREL